MYATPHSLMQLRGETSRLKNKNKTIVENGETLIVHDTFNKVGTRTTTL